jgi:dolichol-phosphate mannosyltransferase
MKTNNPNGADVAVIIPAYNEYLNLRILIPRIHSILPKSSVYVVDDSPLKEAELLKKWAQKYSDGTLFCTSRAVKSGRGSAVTTGMRQALHNKDIRFVVEMDADLSHEALEIPRLIESLASADMVIGSRYVSENLIHNWPMRRLVQSRIINYFLDFWLGLHLTDYTNGFRAYKRKVAECIVEIRLKENGFIQLAETAYRVSEHGFIIKDAPATFTDRKFGKSNADFAEHLQSLRGAIRIKTEKE